MALTFRHIREKDAEAIRDMADDDAVRQYTASIPPEPTFAWARERARTAIMDQRELFGAFEKGEMRAEFGWFLNNDRNLEIGYMVSAKARGRGVAKQAIAFLLNYIRCEKEHSGPIYATVAKDNPASIRLLESAGFERCGEGRYQSRGRGCVVEDWRYQFTLEAID